MKAKTILIADDSPTTIMHLTLLLKSTRHRLLVAKDGLEAIRLVGEERPDLILLDLNMPKMDGFSVLRYLRADGAFSKIPVIVITVDGDAFTKRQCSQQGCQAYLTKPVNVVELNRLLQAFLAGCPSVAKSPAVTGGLPGRARGDADAAHLKLRSSPPSQPPSPRNAKRLEQEIAALRAVSAACLELNDEDRLIERVTDVICRSVDITNFGIVLYDPASQRFHDHPSARRREVNSCLHLTLDEGIVGTVARTGRPMRVPDVRREPRYRMGDPGTLSELTVPLRVGDQLLGVINCENTELDAFSEEDEHLMMALAGQVAPALARLRAMEAIRDREERYRTLYESNPSIYFTLDDRGTVLSVNRFGAEQLGYPVEALVGRPVAEIVHEEDRALVGEQLAWRAAGPRQVLHAQFRLLHECGGILCVRETCHAIRGESGAPLYLMVCEDISEQKRAEDKSEENVRKLRQLLAETVEALARVVEVKDPYTSGHQRRVAQLVSALGVEMGLAAWQVETLRVSGLLHDIGKVQVPAEILSKPGDLSEVERSLVKTHSKVGHQLLKDISFEGPVADIVLQHHERMDGSGYPHGLAGKDILLEARILAVADVVEALSSHRPYRPAFGLDYALEEIARKSGTVFDPKVVDACVAMFKDKGFEFAAH